MICSLRLLCQASELHFWCSFRAGVLTHQKGVLTHQNSVLTHLNTYVKTPFSQFIFIIPFIANEVTIILISCLNVTVLAVRRNMVLALFKNGNFDLTSPSKKPIGTWNFNMKQRLF